MQKPRVPYLTNREIELVIYILSTYIVLRVLLRRLIQQYKFIYIHTNIRPLIFVDSYNCIIIEWPTLSFSL